MATLGNFQITLGLHWVYDGGFGARLDHLGIHFEHMMRICGGLEGPFSNWC